MKMFTITYGRSGRVAMATVQGNEITTVDDLLCIREDGIPLATFPKRDVLQITSNNPGDAPPAPVEELGMPVHGPLDAHAEHREQYWSRLRNALDPIPQRKAAAGRASSGGRTDRRHAVGSVESGRSSASRGR